VNVAGTNVLIDLPANKAINLFKSVLYFQLAILDIGANIGADLQLWSSADCLAIIRQIQLYTRKNTYVADLYEIQNYTQIVWKAETKLENYLIHDQTININTGANNQSINQFQLFLIISDLLIFTTFFYFTKWTF
jgi:hypothetical protein